MAAARRVIQGAEPETNDPQMEGVLRSVLATSREQVPTECTLHELAPALAAGYVYTVNMPRGRFAHLTAKGCHAIGEDPGNRK